MPLQSQGHFAPRMHANMRGIVAMTLGMAAFAVNDSITKFVAHDYPFGEIMFIRGCVNMAILAVAIVALGETRKIRQIGQRWVVTRSLLDVFITLCFLAALMHIKIAELSAIYLSAPIMMAGLALVLYREAIGWRRWSGFIVGFAGTMLVVKPSVGSFEVWTLAAVLAAAGTAARDLITVRIDPKTSTLLIAFAASFALILGGLSLTALEEWRWPASRDVVFFAAAATFYSLATLLLVVAFRGVEVTAVASFRYTYLLWAGIAGYVILGEVPDMSAWAGAALIVCSGLYMAHHEAARRRRGRQRLSLSVD